MAKTKHEEWAAMMTQPLRDKIGGLAAAVGPDYKHDLLRDLDALEDQLARMEMAREMRLARISHLEGAVKSAETEGGHPLLGQLESFMRASAEALAEQRRDRYNAARARVLLDDEMVAVTIDSLRYMAETLEADDNPSRQVRGALRAISAVVTPTTSVVELETGAAPPVRTPVQGTA